MKILFCLLILLVSFDCYSHIEPFELSKGNLTPSQSFSTNYIYEFKFNKEGNFFLQDVGLNYFNVGDDDSSCLFIELYDSDLNLLLKKRDSSIFNIYNQSVFIDLEIMLEGLKNYKLVIGSNDSLNDDLIGLFEPDFTPFSDNLNTISILSIFSFKNKENLNQKSKNCPVISFGISNQIGIDFIEKQQIVKSKLTSDTNEYLTEFKTLRNKIQLTQIGINIFDIGNDKKAKIRMKILDSVNNILFKYDTLLIDSTNIKIQIPCNLELDTNKTYKITFKNLDKNDTNNFQFKYLPKVVPYYDNLQLVKILSFYTNNSVDSFGLMFYLNYELIDKTLNLESKEPFNIKIKQSNNQLDFFCIDINNNDLVYLISPIGEIVNSNSINKNKWVTFDTSKISEGIYFLKTTTNNCPSSKVYIYSSN